VTVRDLVTGSLGNLWRLKLRSCLTISGVVIAIAAFVAMLSFGAGMQRHVTEEFNEFGLFSTMIVYPADPDKDSSAAEAAILDAAAVAAFNELPGVNLAYPFNAFSATAIVADTQVATRAQALPAAAVRTKLFSRLVAGAAFSSDSAGEVMVTESFLDETGILEADSIIGKNLVISVGLASIDSGLAGVLQGVGGIVRDRIEDALRDSLWNQDYWARMVREELAGAMQRFVDGFFNARAIVSDTLVIRGVLESRHSHRLSVTSIIIPTAVAGRLTSGGFSGDPADLLGALNSGRLFAPTADTSGQAYSQVTLNLDAQTPYTRVRDSVQAMGFRTFSYAEQFDEIRQFFVYFDMALGVIGFIALVTASLGIINTMMMSIVERRREIGVLKSLGADEGEIRMLFLAESGSIGLIGALTGVVFGWLITRAASLGVRIIMERQGMPGMELFALPYWLIGTALLFGLAVSLAAGLYPAARAARVDPVEALRNE